MMTEGIDKIIIKLILHSKWSVYIHQHSQQASYLKYIDIKEEGGLDG